MPGLLTLRPLASAAKAAKSTAAKNSAVSAGRTEKVRDDARAQGQGKLVSPAIARARVQRAPALHRSAQAPAHPPAGPPHPHHHHHHHHHHPAQAQQGAAAGGRPGTTTTSAGSTAGASKAGVDAADGAAKDKIKGMEIFQRVGGVDYSSSGSEHEPNSVCLAEMVFDYIEEDLQVGKCGRARCNCGNSCSGGDATNLNENDETRSSFGGEIADVLLGLTTFVSPFERSLSASVVSALQALESDDAREDHESAQSCSTRRWVMSALRSSGYNAAICKSRWEHAGGFPGGDYEYIDVISEEGCGVVVGKSERILVDLDFKAQFEIARPTSLYATLLQSLPCIFVGKPDRLQQIVNIMCDASKRSLKKKGMHLPPWRKPDYIRAKWFSAYRRTTNVASLSCLRSSHRDGITADIGHIALRGSTWDSKFTQDMEKRFRKVADMRMALRDSSNGREQLHPGSRPMMKTSATKLESEPEGQVRGANLMGLLGLNSSDHRHPAAAVDSDVTEAEWEPPAVIPRTSIQRAAAGRVRGGLVSILKESGPAREEGEWKDLQEEFSVTGRQQPGALSKQMAAVV